MATKRFRYGTVLLIVLSFLFFPARILAQTDTLNADTNNHHIGFVLGGGVSYNPLIINDSYIDTLTNWTPQARPLFTIGFSFNKSLSPHWDFQTGLLFTIGSLYAGYTLGQQSRRKEQTNYSTLSVPLLFKFNFKPSQAGFFLKGGYLPRLDISKEVEKNQRVFPVSFFVSDVYFSFGKQFKTEFTKLSLELFFSVSTSNMLKKQESFYSRQLGVMKLYRTGILFSIN